MTELNSTKTLHAPRPLVSLLEKLEAEYEDPGPLYDVLTYVDGTGSWHVCVDTSEQGDLASCMLLEPFRVGHRSASLIATDCD